MKVKWGALMVDGRGKIGGQVASKNRAGAYMRNKVTPSNPNSSAQATARAILSSLSQSWGELTTDQILAWNSAVTDWSTTDIFGDSKNPTGLNLFVKLNTNLLNVGSAIILNPPAKVSTPTAIIVNATYTIASGTLEIVLSDESATGLNALVRATPSLSQGVSFVKSEFRVIGTDVVALDEISLAGAYPAKFGIPVLGANIHATVQFVMPNGQKTIQSSVKVNVVAL